MTVISVHAHEETPAEQAKTVIKIFEEAGFELQHTGGGIFCWGKDIDDEQILISAVDQDDPLFHDPNDKAWGMSRTSWSDEFDGACFDVGTDMTLAETLNLALKGPSFQEWADASGKVEGAFVGLDDFWASIRPTARQENRIMQYAAAGYKFYSVSTPSIFREYEPPTDWSDLIGIEARWAERLEELAEIHGTHIESSSYRRG